MPELVLDDQPAVQQQVDGVVKRGTTDAVLVVFHYVIQRVDVEMAVDGIDFFKDGETLWRFAQLATHQVVDEYLLDGQIGIVKRVFHFFGS